MTTRYYEPVGIDLKLWADPKDFVQAELENELSAVEEIQTLSDNARTYLSGPDGLEAYDASLEIQRVRAANLVDFFDYSNTMINLNVKDGAWFTPVAVQAACGEEVGHEAILTIDGQTNTYWQHSANEAHEITWQLRDYTKRMAKLEVRIGSSSRNLLTDIDIYIADSIDGLDSPTNLVVSGVNLTTPNSWEEIDFVSKQNGRYIRFTGFGSQHAANEVRIQEVRAWVTTIQYN